MEKIGEKIRLMRVRMNLTQEELADRCELSKGFISQVERDLTSPSIATLVDILESLGSNLQEFFGETRDEKVVFTAKDISCKENTEMGQAVKWLIPNAQKNKMEPIYLTLSAGGRTEAEDPHEGEEFGYVLSGMIFLYLGQHKFRVRKGESFYFKPDVEHYLSNPGKQDAAILWISSPPSF